MISRYARIPKFRRTPRRGQPTKKEKDVIRLQVTVRAHCECELRLSPDCIRGELPYSGITPWDHGHLVHLKSVGSGGKWTMENCRWGCWPCHLIELHTYGGNGKPCPPKERVS